MTPNTHIVQFYETDEFLATTVAAFLQSGLTHGAPAIVIATPAHRELIAQKLGAGAQRVRFLDARETLATFMNGTTPDRDRFVEQADAIATPGAYVFGELVDLLWSEDGNPEGALQLEGLWNELTARLSLQLLCAYPMKTFARIADSDAFATLCEAHTHAYPTESFLNAQHREVEICRLQQRAATLATLAHDLRAPLTVILGWSGLLSMGKLDDATTKEAIHSIERSARAEASLLDQLVQRRRLHV